VKRLPDNKCPECKDANLSVVEYQGLTLNYCLDCQGAWLNRDNLSKLLQKNIQENHFHSEDALALSPARAYLIDCHDTNYYKPKRRQVQANKKRYEQRVGSM